MHFSEFTSMGLPDQEADIMTPGDQLEYSPDDTQAAKEVKAAEAVEATAAENAKPAVEYKSAVEFKKAPPEARRVFFYEPLADQIMNEILEKNNARLGGDIGVQAANTLLGMMTSRRQTARDFLDRTLRGWKGLRDQHRKDVEFSRTAIYGLSDKLLMQVSQHIYETSLKLGVEEKKTSEPTQENSTPE